jgi:hypothetical protein
MRTDFFSFRFCFEKAEVEVIVQYGEDQLNSDLLLATNSNAYQILSTNLKIKEHNIMTFAALLQAALADMATKDATTSSIGAGDADCIATTLLAAYTSGSLAFLWF